MRSEPLTYDPRDQLIVVPDHEGIVGKATAYQLGKLGTECSFIGPESAYRHLNRRCCENRQALERKRLYKEHWESLIGLKSGKRAHSYKDDFD